MLSVAATVQELPNRGTAALAARGQGGRGQESAKESKERFKKKGRVMI
jgi:hypothetical protein